MDLKGNFLFIPDKDLSGGHYFELGEESASFAPNSFVLIPYSEPRLQPPHPSFYGIKTSKRVENFLPDSQISIGLVKTDLTRDAYIRKVLSLKEEIQRGNIYEINFCMRFYASVSVEPLAVFRRLCGISKAPYQMLAKVGDNYLMCASPELFLRKEGNILYTKPIKGTKKRGADVQQDIEMRDGLFNSLKDRTENVMAVDVARNDLSILATKGSVEVNKLYNIETFETVHQMVSTIKCELKPGTTFSDIVQATFPMASMTGAPKRRAMQLIGENENFERSYYSGTMGIINHSGDFTLPVLIRSIFYNAGTQTVWFGAGGAITALSDPGEEYEECLLKAGTVLNALGAKLS